MRKITFTTLLAVLFFGKLLAQQTVTPAMIQTAEKMNDLQFNEAKRDSMLSILSNDIKTYAYLHSQNFKNDVPLPMAYNVDLTGLSIPKKQLPVHFNIPANVELPKNINDLAFYSIPQLASLIKNKKISSEKLTRFYLDRLKKYGPVLHCVIELTDTIAIAQAKKADADLAKGIYRGPLHGIPYGIKDLFAVKGTHTTWGTPPYKDQVIDETAFVARQLEKAGAVLVAKLSLGELAEDDVWFGGLTRNPWNINKGSGGSSAGFVSSYCRRTGALCYRDGNLWLHCRSFHALRRYRPKANLWQHIAHRRHGPLLDIG